MTVLQKNAASGINLGRLSRNLGKAVVIAAITFGVVAALNSSDTSQTVTPSATEQVRAEAMVERFTNEYYAEANALNKADIGMPAASTAPFLSGTATPTHTGRTGASAAAFQVEVDRADLIFKQKAAELTDPADRIHKQGAADLAQ